MTIRLRLLAAWAVLSPLVLLLGSTEWLYTPEGYLDPWDYVGYFLSYGHPDFLPGRYKLARLPWILSGWMVHRVFADVAASHVLHLGYLIASTAGMYVLVRQLFSSTTIAGLTAILLGFYTHFHGSGGWDYHNAAAGAFHIWSLAALTYAARRATIGSFMAAGAFIGLAVHANITLVNLIPLFAIHLYVVRRHEAGGSGVDGRTLAFGVLWLTCGGLAITAALMAVNAAMGRDPQFYRALVAIVLRYTADSSTQASWWKPWGRWVLDARYLAAPLVTASIAAAALLVRRSSLSALHRLALGEFVGMVLLWCAWQSMGQTALDWEYFAYPLIPQMFLAVAALLHARIQSVPLMAVVVSPLVFAAALASNLTAVQPLLPAALVAIGSGPAVAASLIAAASLWLPRPLAITAFVLLTACANALAAPVPIRYAAVNPCRTAADFQSAVIAAHRFVGEADAAFEDVTIWFKENERLTVGGGCSVNLGYLGYALAASGVPYVATPFPMPDFGDIPPAVIEEVTRPRKTLIVLSADPEAESLATRHLDAMGIRTRRLDSRRFTVLDGAFTVWLLKLEPRAALARE